MVRRQSHAARHWARSPGRTRGRLAAGAWWAGPRPAAWPAATAPPPARRRRPAGGRAWPWWRSPAPACARAPNTAFSAAVSVASLACVPVPCALTASTSKAPMPARLQRRAHGHGLALHTGARDVAGVVGQAVAQHLAQDGGAAGHAHVPTAPAPAWRHLHPAPCRCGSSKTAGTTPRAQSASTAAPVCSASQALSDPLASGASAPPAMATSSLPGGHAQPGFADGHGRRRTGGGIGQRRALHGVRHADPGGGRVVHAHQDGEGLDAVGVVAVQRLVATVHAGGAAHAGAHEDTDAAAVPGLQCAAVMPAPPGCAANSASRLTAVQHSQLRGVEVGRFVQVGAGHQRRAQAAGKGRVEPAHARAPGAGAGHQLGRAVAQAG
jgi:hypothetical protein